MIEFLLALAPWGYHRGPAHVCAKIAPELARVRCLQMGKIATGEGNHFNHPRGLRIIYRELSMVVPSDL